MGEQRLCKPKVTGSIPVGSTAVRSPTSREGYQVAKEKEMLIVVSKVKEVVKEQEMRSGDDFVNGVNEQVHLIIKAAVARCKANGRQTLKAEDI